MDPAVFTFQPIEKPGSVAYWSPRLTSFAPNISLSFNDQTHVTFCNSESINSGKYTLKSYSIGSTEANLGTVQQ